MHLTVAEQRLLLEMLDKGSITARTQKIFESHKFYDSVAVLIKNGLVRTEENGKNSKIYKLSLSGEVFAIVLKTIKR